MGVVGGGGRGGGGGGGRWNLSKRCINKVCVRMARVPYFVVTIIIRVVPRMTVLMVACCVVCGVCVVWSIYVWWCY